MNNIYFGVFTSKIDGVSNVNKHMYLASKIIMIK